MSEPLATYAFLPWLRRGFAADISRIDGTAGPAPRSSVSVNVRFNSNDALSGSVTLAVLGPGEVKGLDARTIVRTVPRAGVMDAEPNYFPLIEFDQADLPWRYTPARATSGDRLTPWLMLIVVADDEVKQIIPSRNGDLGRIEIKDAAVLPKHSQLWAWAHVQYSGESTIDESKASQLLGQASPQLIARILCPRRLKPRTAYNALLVPSFQRGVLAGMGQKVPDTVDALAPAWTDDASGPLTLPVYYQWRFGTGMSGDFESLARLLKRFEAPASVGIRDMDVSAPSPGLPPAATSPLGLRGMLEALGTNDKPWSDAERNAWIAALKPLLNLPKERLATAGAPRVVVPPLYGQWPAATDECAADNPGARPPWFQALSVDPRLRVGAALGTQIIQENQESLMASAWEQVERVRQLNEELRQAQLAREIALRLHTRHVFVPDAEAVLAVTAPLHARVKASPTTIRSVLTESPVPRGVFDGAFRRIARPLGPIGRRQGRAADPARTGFFDRLNRGLLSAAPPPPVPSDMATPDRLGKGLAPLSETTATIASRIRLARLLQILALILIFVAFVIGLLGLAAIAASFGAAAIALGGAAFGLTRNAANLSRRVALRDGTLTGDAIRATPAAANFLPQEVPPGGAPRDLPTTTAAAPANPELVSAFRESVAQLFDRIAPPTVPIRVATPVNIAALQTTLAQTLEPRVTFAAAYRKRFEFAPSVHWQPDDPIEPINAAPEFPQPMYQELCKLSPDWLLPGLSEVPRNSVTLLKTNQTMVEAFMIGLNHEMARELLWREYPTEQRATYFRQFWDVSGAVPPPGQTIDPETLKDIKPIHAWPKASNLGTHRPHSPPSGGDYLVLLIRGDLLHRYPNTIVYAAKAKWLSTGLRDIDDPLSNDPPDVVQDKQRWPVFSGKFEPDASFFGFALTKDEVRGSSNPSDNRPGFYFVLQEHSSEPRFGLDEADPATLGQPVVGANWDNLSWGSLATDATALDVLATIDLNADLPDTGQIQSTVTKKWHADTGRGQAGSRASDLAYITFQRPMRVGIHSEDMVP